jgi:hypothetical protein
MKANAGQMRKAKRGKRVGEKEGNEKGKQPGRRRAPLSTFLSSFRVSSLSVLFSLHSLQRAGN